MGATLQWDELQTNDSRSIGSFAAGWGEGGETIVFDVKDPSPDTLAFRITDLLGDVRARGDGRLSRKLPAAHPRFPFWTAQAISSGQGVGKFNGTPAPPMLEVPPIEVSPVWTRYLIGCRFGQERYAILADNAIGVYNGSYYDVDGVEQHFVYAKEWERFTDWHYSSLGDAVSAQQGGGMVFRSPGSVPNIDNTPFTGMPRMYLHNQLLKMQWFRIPERYMSSPKSYLSSLVGTLNQNEFYNWSVGSLLFLGAETIERKSPPVPVMSGWTQTNLALTKVVDVELTWLKTTRRVTAPPAAPVNLNWLVAGHNLQPNVATRKFHYTTVNIADPAKQVPSFESAPHELLFCDPDFPQPAGVVF